MHTESVTQFLLTKGKFFKAKHLPLIRQYLEDLDENTFKQLSIIEFKDPTLTFIISLFLGQFGIDRFYIGHITLGVLKLCSLAACYIWAIVDWFLIINLTKQKNFEQFLNTLLLLKPLNKTKQ